jgi:CheY-like chemotaxis protein
MRSNERPAQVNQTTNQVIACDHAAMLQGVDILLVEDELDIAELLIVMLESAGASVAWATLAEEALTVIQHSQPDVLLCNVKLPDRNGDWLIRQIRTKEAGQSYHLPAVAVTSFARDVTAERMLSAGFDRFLSKLQSPNEIVLTIAQLL